MADDSASLKMEFDGAIELFLRMHLRSPARPPFDAPAQLREVYQRAYECALRRAAQFVEADDPSIVEVPPELDELPFAEAWAKGNSAGDGFGRLMRSVILSDLQGEPHSL